MGNNTKKLKLKLWVWFPPNYKCNNKETKTLCNFKLRFWFARSNNTKKLKLDKFLVFILQYGRNNTKKLKQTNETIICKIAIA